MIEEMVTRIAGFIGYDALGDVRARGPGNQVAGAADNQPDHHQERKEQRDPSPIAPGELHAPRVTVPAELSKNGWRRHSTCPAPAAIFHTQIEVGTPRCGVPARVRAGGSTRAARRESEHPLRPSHGARTAQRAVPTIHRAELMAGTSRSAPSLPPASTARCGAHEISGLESLNPKTRSNQAKFFPLKREAFH